MAEAVRVKRNKNKKQKKTKVITETTLPYLDNPHENARDIGKLGRRLSGNINVETNNADEISKDLHVGDVGSGVINKCLKDEVVESSLKDEVVDSSLTDEVVDTSLKDEVVDSSLKDEVIGTSLKDEVISVSLKDEVVDSSLKDEVIGTSLKDEVICVSLNDEVIGASLKDEVVDTSLTDEVIGTSLKNEVVYRSLEDELKLDVVDSIHTVDPRASHCILSNDVLDDTAFNLKLNDGEHNESLDTVVHLGEVGGCKDEVISDIDYGGGVSEVSGCTDTGLEVFSTVGSNTLEREVTIDSGAFTDAGEGNTFITDTQEDSDAGALLLAQESSFTGINDVFKNDAKTLQDYLGIATNVDRGVGTVDSAALDIRQGVVNIRKEIEKEKHVVGIKDSRTRHSDVREVHMIHDVQPLSLEQLQSVYFNTQLAQNPHFIDVFVQREQKRDDHEFYEILRSYNAARIKFVAAEQEVRSSQAKYSELVEQLWVTTQKTVTAEGQCGDDRNVSRTQPYETVDINHGVLRGVVQVLQEIRSVLVDKFSLYAYAAQLSRLQVESYIHDLIATSPALREIPRNASVQAVGRHSRGSEVKSQVDRLRDCISVLFMFHRRPSADEHFVRDIRAWTDRLVASLLRIAIYEDHLFLLNHILRAPAGVGAWAAHYIQLTSIPSDPSRSTFGAPELDHFVTTLATLFLPVDGREAFMSHMNRNLPSSQDADNVWILVDSDGEEDEDPANAWLHLHENDLVAILKQCHLADVFSHIFLMNTDIDASGYNAWYTSDAVMLKVFAFVTCLVRLLEEGLQTFSMSRYRQLNKRLGRMIRHVVLYVSEHWQNYRDLHSVDPSMAAIVSRLHIEFDQFFLRSTYSILTAEKLGSWQFMVEMPYYGVSTVTMWKLLWILHQDQSKRIDLNELPNFDQCKSWFEDETNLLLFSDNLVKLPTSEAIYLLTTFSNMAQARPAEERAFIETVALGIFEISYVNDHTRDFCSKVGRELLLTMALSHPFVMSTLLHRVYNCMSQVDQMSLYLYRELPLSHWVPTREDTDILKHWLMTYDLSCTANQLARVILSNLNWGYNRLEDDLALTLTQHREVALLLVEAYNKYTLSHADQFVGYAILEGMKQLRLSISNQMTNDQLFNIWVWDLVLRLRLHTSSQPKRPMGAVDTTDIPSLAQDDWTAPLLRGVAVGSGVACYVALSMTTYGHSMTEFMSQGLNLLSSLSSQNEHQAVIQILYRVTPLFYAHSECLTGNMMFQKILKGVLTADDSPTKVAKLLLRETFPGDTLRLLADMIQTQVMQSCTPDHVGGSAVTLFWVSLLCQCCPKWYNDRSCCYLIDNLVKVAFTTKGGLSTVQDYFRSRFIDHIRTTAGTSSGLTSFVNWISSGVTLTSYIERSSSAQFVWLAFIVLDTEGWYEATRGIWRGVQQELFNDLRLSVDQAVRKAVSRLKLTSAPAPHRMNIYRWAQQAVDTPIEHPLLPIVFQRFFVLYLGRQVTDTGLPHRASVGEKFFESMAQVSACKRMKKHLGEAARFYQNTSDSLFRPKYTPSGSPILPRKDTLPDGQTDVQRDAHTPDAEILRDPEPRLEHTDYVPNKDFYDSLARMYQTFVLWMDEPRLHDPHLYLPSLPPQYEADKLLRVFHNSTEAWDEYINHEKVEYELTQMVSEWINRNGPSSCYNRRHARADMAHGRKTPSEHMIQRINNEPRPCPPPTIVPLKPPVPEVTLDILRDQDSLMYTLNAGLTCIKDFAKLFSLNTSKHVALDCTYVELLPNEYYNETTTISLDVPCYTRGPFKCKQPAVKQVEISLRMQNESVERQIDENRANYNQTMIEALLPPPQVVCTAAVHVENAITMLVKLSQGDGTDAGDRGKLCNVATVLFYHMASMVDDQVNFYNPTLQFFSSCIEILGKTFISHNTAQVQSLLDFSLENPVLTELMAPHFIPNSSPRVFLLMYEHLLTFPNIDVDFVFMLLSKFDVLSWLQKYRPSDTEVATLVNVTMTSLKQCGADDVNNILPPMLNGHLKSVLKYDFPSKIEPVLAALLRGSVDGQLSGTCWEGFYTTCTEGVVTQTDGTVTPLTLNALSIAQIQHVLEWLASFFHQTRLAHTHSSSFGLYPTWGVYTNQIARFIHDLCDEIAGKILPNIDEWTPTKALDYLWQLLVNAYNPWVQPLHNQNEVLLPWLEADSIQAVQYLESFIKNVGFLHKILRGHVRAYTIDPLSLVLVYYASVLAKRDTPDFILTLYHIYFMKLPWEDLTPGIEVMEIMAKIKEENSADSFMFLSQLFPRINWATTMHDYLGTNDPDLLTRAQSALFSLLLQIHVETDLMADQEELIKCFLMAQKYNWDHLSSAAFIAATDVMLLNCDCTCVLAERTSTQALGLRLIRLASGFSVVGSAKWNINLSKKRIIYIRCVVQLLCQVSFREDLNTETFHSAIVNILTDIETIESAVADVSIQYEESFDMINQLFSLLNNCNPSGPSLDIVITTITEWLQSSPNSILILPCLRSSSRSLASFSHMTQIAETTLVTYFMTVDSIPGQCKQWFPVLASLKLPELNLDDYFAEAVHNGAYLTLNAYILQQLPLCAGLASEWRLMQLISGWLVTAKPKQQNEMRLILLVQRFLELLTRQVNFGGDQSGVATQLTAVTTAFSSFGEDREPKGFFGAIGFGKKSPLSLNFRTFSRCLSAFLAQQLGRAGGLCMADDVAVTTVSPTPVAAATSQLSRNTRTTLKVSLDHKDYRVHRELIEFTAMFIADGRNTILAWLTLLAKLSHNLFPSESVLWSR